MKHAAIVLMMLMTGISGARADYYDVTDHDLVRPHGRPRPDAVHQAAVASCSKLTAATAFGPDTGKFKHCMLRRGYRTQDEHLVRTTAAMKLALSGVLNARQAFAEPLPR